MTIREELQKLGPERVRNAMVAFEHRGDDGYMSMASCPDEGGRCCFLNHAHRDGEAVSVVHWDHLRRSLTGRDMPPAIESAFENHGRSAVKREGLRQECIAFLAEHGNAVEVAPKKSPHALRVAAVLCLLLLVLVV